MIILENIEYLEEMATVYKSTEKNCSVAVNPDSNRIGFAYFKFYNSSNFRNATKVVRILFTKPDFVYHRDGLRLWELNSGEKKLLIEVLKSPSNRFKGHTIWDAAKFEWNSEYFEEMFDVDIYFAGGYDEKYKGVAGYVPSTLEMPDYTQLDIKMKTKK